MADGRLYAQLQNFSLAGAGAVIGDTTLVIKSMLTIDGAALTMATAFGTKGWGTIEPNSGEREEQISFTGLTNNANGTTTLTGVKTVLFIAPYTEASGLAKTHAGSTTFVITNTSGFYGGFANKFNDEDIVGQSWTIDDPVLAREIANKQYVDGVAVAGAPNASTTVKGIVEEATQAEVDAQTAAGGTAARLFINPTTQRSYLNSSYVLDTGAANAYAIAPSPAWTAYTTGMVVIFKATNANTAASTLAVSGLATKAIQKNGAALVGGEIGAGDILICIYDSTAFQIESTTNPARLSSTYTVNADEVVNSWFTWTTPLLVFIDGGPVYGINGFTNTGTYLPTGITTDMFGGVGLTDISFSGAGTAFSKIPGNGSNNSFTAASSKDLRLKMRWRFYAAGGAGNYTSFGFVDAATTLDDIQTAVTIGLRIVNNNGTIYAATADGSANTNTDISSSLTYTNWNIFEIVFNPGTNVKYYVNGTLAATHTTNLPTGSLAGFGFGAAIGGNLGASSPITFSIEQ